jgi:hypothetical protein
MQGTAGTGTGTGVEIVDERIVANRAVWCEVKAIVNVARHRCSLRKIYSLCRYVQPCVRCEYQSAVSVRKLRASRLMYPLTLAKEQPQ